MQPTTLAESFAAVSRATDRREEITTRVLAIDAELAERKRAFFCDGVPSTQRERSTLEAERAALLRERHELHLLLRGSRNVINEARRARIHAVLVRSLIAAGLQHMVDEAEREANDLLARAEQESTT